MNQAELTAPRAMPPMLRAGSTLRLRQVLAIFRIEFLKSLLSRRALPIYGLVIIPIFMFAFAAINTLQAGSPVFGNISEAREIFGFTFSSLILGAVIFLGCAAIFTTSFRGEILNRSIHYYLLAPVRRELLVAGKFLAGYAAAVLLFGACTLICFLLMYVQFGLDQLISDLTTGVAGQQLGQYLGITLLACLGYGSVFMAAGLLFRNPLIPVLLIAFLEAIHFVLPPALKVFSIIHYLKGLLPIPLDEGPLAVIVSPPPLWVSIFGMVLLSAVMLAVAVLLLRRLEVRYTDE